jgi:hypothetical protein
MGGSLNVFGYHPDAIIDYLKKSTPNGEAIDLLRAAYRQRALAQQGHERCMIGQNADLTIERGRDHRVGIAVEHRGLGGDYRDSHHELASFFDFSTASSIPPTI